MTTHRDIGIRYGAVGCKASCTNNNVQYNVLHRGCKHSPRGQGPVIGVRGQAEQKRWRSMTGSHAAGAQRPNLCQ